MASFEEGRQRFDFDDSWIVVKYDGHPYYKNKVAALPETKAVDFVGLRGDSDHTLFWIEVKDFRGYRIQNKQRISDGDLAIEIGQKVRDSIAGIIGAHKNSGDSDTWRPFVRAMANKNATKVLLWLEEDLPHTPPGRRENQGSVLTNLVKRNLRWLTSRVFVVNGRTGGCPDGLVVTELHGAGQN